MAYNERLAERLRDTFATNFAGVSGIAETRMFGGFGYMLNGNMCVGIHNDDRIIRVGVD